MIKLKSSIKSRAPEPWVAAYIRLRSSVGACVAGICSRSAGLAAIYFLVTGTFSREHRSVLAGRNAYHHSMRSPISTSSFLRRSIHRLEKGLISQPRREIFATLYIGETVRTFAQLAVRAGCALPREGELRWAHDVLAEYFSVCAPHPAIDSARAEFDAIAPRLALEPRPNALVPSSRESTLVSSVSSEEFHRLSIQRRSVRWFLRKHVPRDCIDSALLTARLAPSACNRQPFRFVIYDDPDLVQKIARVPGGTVGFADNFPSIALVLGRLDGLASDRDRHLIYVDASLASMAFMLALETHGISSCPINWPDVNHAENELAGIVGLEAYERPIMLIAMGFADPRAFVPASEKLPLSELRTFNRVRMVARRADPAPDVGGSR